MTNTFTRTEHLDGKVTLYGGDNRDVLKSLPDNSIDSIVTDPPYALVSIQKRFGGANAKPTKDGDVYSRASAGFMGKQWDTGEVAFSEVFWAECLRVLKPGGHVVAFSGTRTYHRMAVAIEDAGFEIRDQLAWAYGSGFPKSQNVAKFIDKHVGAEGSLGAPRTAAHARFMKGDVTRVCSDGWSRPWMDDPEAVAKSGAEYLPGSEVAREWQGWGTALKPAWEPICLARKPLIGTVAENVLEHGTGALNIDGCRVGTEGGTALGCSADKSETTSVGGYLNAKAGAPIDAGRWPANIVHDGSDEVLACFPDAKAGGNVSGKEPSSVTADVYGDFAGRVPFSGFADSGSASRFFYTAKADKLDRIGSKHPTVKPVDLMQWLVRLVTPKGGLVLDPFAGSGSTGEAAWREGMRCILIEREEEYQADIAERLRLANAGPATRKARAIKQVANDNLPLFGGAEATGGGYEVRGGKSTATSQTKTDGGIMAGKGGFGFRIREQKLRTAGAA